MYSKKHKDFTKILHFLSKHANLKEVFFFNLSMERGRKRFYWLDNRNNKISANMYLNSYGISAMFFIDL